MAGMVFGIIGTILIIFVIVDVCYTIYLHKKEIKK
jgi:hypothetical protein